MIFLADFRKKSYLLSSSSLAKANEVMRFYHKEGEIRIQLSSLPDPLKFRIGAVATICTSTKVKDSVVHFTTDTNMSGKVDISLLPIELV